MQTRITLEAAYRSSEVKSDGQRKRKTAKNKERAQAKRYCDEAGDFRADRNGKHKHTCLLCGVIKSSWVVQEKKLTQLIVNVDECGDGLAKFFTISQDNKDRGTMVGHPGVPFAKFSIDVSVEDHTVVDTAVTQEEHDALRVLVWDKVQNQRAINDALDVDYSDEGDEADNAGKSTRNGKGECDTNGGAGAGGSDGAGKGNGGDEGDGAGVESADGNGGNGEDGACGGGSDGNGGNGRHAAGAGRANINDGPMAVSVRWTWTSMAMAAMVGPVRALGAPTAMAASARGGRLPRWMSTPASRRASLTSSVQVVTGGGRMSVAAIRKSLLGRGVLVRARGVPLPPSPASFVLCR
eukprot:TRINITY_DN3765_c0_g1_i4.p1 TRINITY_DN3765_c0_g1~~TRINITY_DN3765_c0_g1_i4.p1  ORF type:complete len:352 (+),score=63.29 TRINITY_DN3765_c0_g1_i4:2299-3354(+)